MIYTNVDGDLWHTCKHDNNQQMFLRVSSVAHKTIKNEGKNSSAPFTLIANSFKKFLKYSDATEMHK